MAHQSALHGVHRQRRSRRQAGHLENLALVERLTLQQRTRELVQRTSMLAEQPRGLVVALADDPLDLEIDDARSLLAERLRAAIAVEAREIRILAWRQLHQTDAVTHAPSRHHVPCERRRL